MFLLLNRCAKSQRTHFLSILTDRVRQPSAPVTAPVTAISSSNSCTPLIAEELHTFVLLVHTILQRFVKKFANLERISLLIMNPVNNEHLLSASSPDEL